MTEFAAEAAQLLARYAWAIDGRDWEALREVFTADVKADYEAFTCSGVDEIVDRMRSLHEDLDGTQHLIGSILLDSNGRDLRVRSQVCATLVKRGHLDGPALRVSAHYDDTVRATAAGLRIAIRSVRGLSVDGNRALLPWLPAPRAGAGVFQTQHSNGV